MINKIDLNSIDVVLDLTVGTKCFLCLKPNGRAFHVEYLGWDDSGDEPDFHFRNLPKNGLLPGISYYGINEIGVGRTANQAVENYGKMSIEQFQGKIPKCTVTPGRVIFKH